MIGRPSPGLGGHLPARGPGRWLRPVAYGLVLVAAQGLLSRLADAVGWPAPDLFLLTGLALGLRAAPLPALLLAYGVGFGQDLLGGGRWACTRRAWRAARCWCCCCDAS